PSAGGGWTIAALCIGLALIAATVVIPQADANRRLVYEREKLRMDLDQIRKQVAVNGEFLKKIENDPQLAERLAQRQMKFVRQGTSILELKGEDQPSATGDMSPFQIVNVPPPPALPPYQPIGGLLASACRSGRSQLYVLGAGMMLVAMGLVLGASARP